jgi:hypothetical protein
MYALHHLGHVPGCSSSCASVEEGRGGWVGCDAVLLGVCCCNTQPRDSLYEGRPTHRSSRSLLDSEDPDTSSHIVLDPPPPSLRSPPTSPKAQLPGPGRHFLPLSIPTEAPSLPVPCYLQASCPVFQDGYHENFPSNTWKAALPRLQNPATRENRGERGGRARIPSLEQDRGAGGGSSRLQGPRQNRIVACKGEELAPAIIGGRTEGFAIVGSWFL